MDIILALQRLASPALDRVMLLVTDVGSQEAYTVLLVFAYLAVDAAFGRRLGIVFLAGAFINELIKGAVQEPRPFEVNPAVARTSAALETAPGSSFPSGHAQQAALFWGLAAVHFRRAWFWVLAAVVVALVSVSRVYLGVHYPADVLAGLGLGVAVLLASLLLRRLAFEPGKAVIVVLGLALPLALHLFINTPNSHVYLAALSAFAVGPEIVTHRASGDVVTRLLMGVLGVVLVGAVMGLTSAVMPEELKRALLPSYLRYLVIGLTGTLLAPLACRALRLSGGPAVAAGSARRY
ncbi:MAG TPA: phosphatase PAP2 family protein [Trueperaceae bacterium]|nr:phosphatase PAP2 family protein [Trueperaceae bacterium]